MMPALTPWQRLAYRAAEFSSGLCANLFVLYNAVRSKFKLISLGVPHARTKTRRGQSR